MRLASERERMRVELNRGRAEAEASKVFASETRGASIDAALRSGRAREERLIVRSPIAGRDPDAPASATSRAARSSQGSLLAEVGDGPARSPPTCRCPSASSTTSSRTRRSRRSSAATPRRSAARVVSLAPAALTQPATASPRVGPGGAARAPRAVRRDRGVRQRGRQPRRRNDREREDPGPPRVLRVARLAGAQALGAVHDLVGRAGRRGSDQTQRKAPRRSGALEIATEIRD